MRYNGLFNDVALPKVLSEKELYDYFVRYKSGDKKAREIIIYHNIKLVLNRVLKKFYDTNYDIDDLVSVGIIGLINAVDTFDVSKNYKFSSYASVCIDNKIVNFIRDSKKHLYNDSLEDVLFNRGNGGKEIKIKDAIRDDNADFLVGYEQNELYSIIREIVYSFKGREKDILILYFGFDNGIPVSQSEISYRYNISQTHVSRLLRRSLEKISTRLHREGVVEGIEVWKKRTKKC